MKLKLFGFTLLTPREVLENSTTPSVVPPPNNQGATTITESGMGVFGGYSINFDSGASISEVDLINQYRDLALQPDIDEAINDIVNEMIIREDDDLPVSISVEELPEEFDDEFRHQLREEFDHVMTLLEFKDKCYDIARQFYVDGRLFYDLIIDEQHPENGIVELRNIDPRVIRPVREIKETLHLETGVPLVDVVDEYYVYNPMGFRGTAAATTVAGTRISKDRIAYVNSGIFTPGNVQVLSWLHKAIKPYNQLRMVEDATVIYRITRAPERRVFYIDVADLPTNRAEQYINNVATRYRNRVTYDTNTGEVRDDRKVQSMLEDFFLPRRSNGRGTEVQQLEGGQNLGVMEDVEYFRRKLFRALNLPMSRMEPNGGSFQLGRATEITRDEIKFNRFLARLRARLGMLFDEMMSRHLTLKGVIPNQRIWQDIRRYVRYEFVKDSYFSELKEVELLRERLTTLQQMEPYIGRFFSDQYVQDRVLRQSADEQKQIKAELATGQMTAGAQGLLNPGAGMDPTDPMNPMDPTGQQKQLPPGAPNDNPFDQGNDDPLNGEDDDAGLQADLDDDGNVDGNDVAIAQDEDDDASEDDDDNPDVEINIDADGNDDDEDEDSSEDDDDEDDDDEKTPVAESVTLNEDLFLTITTPENTK